MALQDPVWYVVKDSFEAAKGMQTIRLIPEKASGFSFKPGQFIALRQYDENKQVYRRMYSIASSPNKPGELEFTIRVLGTFTQRLAALKPGARIELDGPYGMFVFDESKPNSVFLAGGCGITPFMSMTRYALEKNLPNRITLFYSSREQCGTPYTQELREMEKKNPNFKLVITLTRETPSGWSGETGRIDEKMLKKYVGALEDPQYYICGTPDMSKGTKEMLLSLGVPKEQIHMEGW